jgi:cell division protein FtsL
MENYTKIEKLFYSFLIILAVLIVGIQIGIKQGKELQKQEPMKYEIIIDTTDFEGVTL